MFVTDPNLCRLSLPCFSTSVPRRPDTSPVRGPTRSPSVGPAPCYPGCVGVEAASPTPDPVPFVSGSVGNRDAPPSLSSVVSRVVPGLRAAERVTPVVRSDETPVVDEGLGRVFPK